MNKEEILEMEAGREMDKRVALVLGYGVVESSKIEAYVTERDNTGAFHYVSTLPYYSTDISAAWQVVEKLTSDEFWITLRYTPVNFWSANFEKNQYGFYHKCNSAPEAICKAALLTKLEAKNENT